MVDITTPEQYAEGQRLVNHLTAPAIRSAIRDLAPARGSRGLDAGCGLGLRTLMLAEVVGGSGSVTGIDVSDRCVALAREEASRSSVGGRVAVEVEDVLDTRFEDSSFDWAWCADTLYVIDQHRALAELARVVRPGGSVALVFWSGQMLLPGYPRLEARLDEAFTRWAPYLAGVEPGGHSLEALGWLARVGLTETRVGTYAAQAHAPLESGTRDALAFCFGMLWGELAPHVTASDLSEYRRLCDPASDGCILDSPGYYAFVTYSMFTGKVPESR